MPRVTRFQYIGMSCPVCTLIYWSYPSTQIFFPFLKPIVRFPNLSHLFSFIKFIFCVHRMKFSTAALVLLSTSITSAFLPALSSRSASVFGVRNSPIAMSTTEVQAETFEYVFRNLYRIKYNYDI
jgi:hypothetical protein